MTRSTTPQPAHDGGLHTIHIPGNPAHPGYAIPAPTDPDEAAAWRTAVQQRADRGLGGFVGQDLICRDGAVLPDEQWTGAPNPRSVDDNRDMLLAGLPAHVTRHFSGGVCETQGCATTGFTGYDGHPCWPTPADWSADHHPDGALCERHRPCGQPDCPKPGAGLIGGRYEPARVADMFARATESFLTRFIDRGHVLAEAALWELGRREHERNREHKLSPGYRNPVPAHLLDAGDVISEGCSMRALIREAYTLPVSGQVVLGVSWINVVTGVPEERVHELPPLAADDRSLHLVTTTLADVAPYAVPLAVTR